MPQYQETLLAKQLVRLDRSISDAKNLASSSCGEATREALKKELLQLVETRQQIEVVWRRMKSLNSAICLYLITFCLSFAALVLLGLSGLYYFSQPSYFALVFLDVLALIGSGAAHIGLIVLRDAIARGHRPWRFRLRTLLVVTTVVAVVLFLLLYVGRM